ncbi:hypothetical protein RND71_020758 [Anisodus tanguticus]|uniref:FAF domain-containing protein n=1 Tax=Anisodus tanguticus TaxID=243964 RepID=A0AAE1RU02_9SOLA|nr:hypothetical protein RND71_020758 [Anisodus tanguticus]
MSTHYISTMKNFKLSLKIKEEEAISMEKEDHHDQLIKDQPTITFDWSSILSSKHEDSTNKLISTSPYVHPLDKRSTSSLSEKSLEICTESLGSETGSGSGCFSSSPTSDNVSHVSESTENFLVVKYNYSKRLLSSPEPFPPSLPSVHVQSHRQNGRLTLEAVSVPHKNSLHAQRLDDHLLLTFTNRNDFELEMENYEDEVEDFEQVFDDIQEVEGNETPHSNSGDSDEEEEKECVVMEQSLRLSSEVINVNRAALMMLEKKNQLAWSKCTVSFSMTSGYFHFNSRFNRSINLRMEEEKDTSNVKECYTYPSLVSQSLPPAREAAEVILAPPLPPAAAASLNAYEYFWWKKPTVGNIMNNSTIAEQCNKNKYYYNNKQVVITTTTNGTDTKATSTTKIAACTHNKASMNNLVPLLRSCKEPRRSIREPYCIATS